MGRSYTTSQRKELEHQRSRSELEERLRECESRWRKSQEEAFCWESFGALRRFREWFWGWSEGSRAPQRDEGGSMVWKRKVEEVEPEAEEEDEEEARYYGFIHQASGDKMFVTCDGVPEEFASRPPKITRKSEPPPGLKVGSWITFELLDEWPGENWGSLLVVNIQPAEPPEDWDPSSIQPAERKTGRAGAKPRATMAAAAEKFRAAHAARGSVGRAPAPRQKAAMSKAFPGADDASGLAKSGAVAAFRQAKEEGRSFESGWSAPAERRSAAPRNRTTKARRTEHLPPFQKAFLEAPDALSAEEVESMRTVRESTEVSVEMPDQLPDVFPPISTFEDLSGILPDYAFRGLSEMGIETPMPIQAQAIPMALAGLDVVGIAKTGSGKTLAYLLPALAHVEVQEPKVRGAGTPMVLILAPTRELAVQICDMAKAVMRFSKKGSNHPDLSAGVLYGGGQGSKGWQVADIKSGGQVVAATPGRLLDVMDSGDISLERVTYFVLDEADRMLECGFEEQVGRIGSTVRRDRHTLFFSATWPSKVQDMAQVMCSSDLPPVRVMVGQRGDGEGPVSRADILQEVVVFDQASWSDRDAAKQELLYAHLREVLSDDAHKILVFVSRKSTCPSHLASVSSARRPRKTGPRDLADTLAKRLKEEGFSANVMCLGA
ncbi:unnamed protein product [Effrenium voratum]|nr:unnamed protein product [Effrenium voratum]